MSFLLRGGGGALSGLDDALCAVVMLAIKSVSTALVVTVRDGPIDLVLNVANGANHFGRFLYCAGSSR